MTHWFRDDEKYSKWSLSLRRQLIVADEISAAMQQPRPDGRISVTFDTSDLKGLANTMTVQARFLRGLADTLEQTVATGLAKAEVRPHAPGPKRPQ